jgi:hypothetical protein
MDEPLMAAVTPAGMGTICFQIRDIKVNEK